MISVIMSTYCEQVEYVEASVQSILNQTYSDFEFIIVIDNPENIEVIEYVKKVALADGRIKILINEKNIGLVASLNKALKSAVGEYVARMDADDIAFPDRFEKELQLMKDYDLVASSIKYIDRNGKRVSCSDVCAYGEKALKKIIRFRNCMPHPTWLVKKEVYESLNGYRNVKFCEDYDFILRTEAMGYSIGMCSTPTLKYRINENGISRSNTFSQFMTSVFLSKNRKRINNIRLVEIEQFLNHYGTRSNRMKFNQALELFDRASHETNVLKRICICVTALTKTYAAMLFFKVIVKEKIIRTVYS